MVYGQRLLVKHGGAGGDVVLLVVGETMAVSQHSHPLRSGDPTHPCTTPSTPSSPTALFNP
jgi:hypothetical protein